MTLKQLEYVVAVAKYGSLSRAGENLYVSQPTISEAIQNLEDELGFQIFLRQHSGMSLTPDGEDFLAEAQTIIEQMAWIERRYLSHGEKKVHFSVSSTHFYFTQSAFARLSKSVDGRYMLRHLDSRKLDVLNEVASGISEIGLLSYTEENRAQTLRKLKSMNLEYSILCTSQPAAYLSTAHPLATRKSLKIEDLRAYPSSTFYQGPTVSRYFEEEMYQLPEWDKELVMQDNGAVTFFLLGTDCFSIGTGVVPESILPLGLCTIPITDIPACTIIWIKRKNHELSEIAERFLCLCKEEFATGFQA